MCDVSLWLEAEHCRALLPGLLSLRMLLLLLGLLLVSLSNLLQRLAALFDRSGNGLRRVDLCHPLERRVGITLHGIRAAGIAVQCHLVDSPQTAFTRSDHQGSGEPIAPFVRRPLMLVVELSHALSRLLEHRVVGMAGLIDPWRGRIGVEE